MQILIIQTNCSNIPNCGITDLENYLTIESYAYLQSMNKKYNLD